MDSEAMVVDIGAAGVIAAFPEIRKWAVGSHSLGGAMAARSELQNPDVVQGLVKWAAYPAATDDLSAYSIIAASIYGTRDGLAAGDEIDASRPPVSPLAASIVSARYIDLQYRRRSAIIDARAPSAGRKEVLLWI